MDAGAAGRDEPGVLELVLTPQVVVISEVPLPARAAAGEHHGSDEVSPTEPHRVPFPFSFPCQEQENEASQCQHRAPHAANVVLPSWMWAGQKGVSGEFCWNLPIYTDGPSTRLSNSSL